MPSEHDGLVRCRDIRFCLPLGVLNDGLLRWHAVSVIKLLQGGEYEGGTTQIPT